MFRQWRNRIVLALGVAFTVSLLVGAYHSRLDGELLAAVGRNDFPAVRTLLDRGANPNLCYTDDEWIVYDYYSDFHSYVAPYKGPVSSLTLWERIKHPFLDMRASRGRSLLSFAAFEDDSQVAIALIEHGANVNVVRENDIDPLSDACGWGNVSLARALLKAGADVNGSANCHCECPLWTALLAIKRKNETGLLPMSERLALVRLLVESGVDLKVKNMKVYKDETALDCYRLCGGQRNALVDYLIQHGAVWPEDEKAIQ